jgi:hypothetical protein
MESAVTLLALYFFTETVRGNKPHLLITEKSLIPDA